MKYHYFEVRVPMVEGVGVNRWRQYIDEAVSGWAGQFEPVGGGHLNEPPTSGDPLGPPCAWRDSVKVKRI